MATPEQFAKQLREAIRQLNANRAKELKTVAADGLALVVSRVQNKGLKANGQRFPPYSRTPVPAYWMAARAPSAAAKNKLKKQKTASYYDLRRAAGVKTNITNLTFSGGMWRGTSVQPFGETNETATVRLGGFNPRARRLLFYNSIRYGNVLQFAPREVQIIADAYAERQLNTIIRALR